MLPYCKQPKISAIQDQYMCENSYVNAKVINNSNPQDLAQPNDYTCNIFENQNKLYIDDYFMLNAMLCSVVRAAILEGMRVDYY